MGAGRRIILGDWVTLQHMGRLALWIILAGWDILEFSVGCTLELSYPIVLGV